MLQTLCHRPPPVILEAEVRPFFREQFQDVKVVVGNLSFVNAGLDRGHMGRGVPVLVGNVQTGSGFQEQVYIPDIAAAYGLKKQGAAVDVWGV